MGTGGLPAEIGTTMQNQHPKVNSRAAGNWENMALALRNLHTLTLVTAKVYILFSPDLFPILFNIKIISS